jgi:hypothetical protein
VPGLPQFRAGEEWVLLAYPPSEAGLTSPVGLFQGAFRVRTVAAGDRTVAIPGSRRALKDDLRQAGLTSGVRGATARAGAGTTVPYTTFMQHLRDLVAGVPQATGAAAGRRPSPATDLEAAAAARGAGRRP